MFQRIEIKDYKKLDATAVLLNADVFHPIKYTRRIDEISKRVDKDRYLILEAMEEGEFTGCITDLAYGRARNIVGEDKFHKYINKKITSNPKARFFQIRIARMMNEYRQISAYSKFFYLLQDGNLHRPDLSTIIVAIELKRPVVSDDVHFWIYQNNILKAYAARWGEGILKLYTAHDFCKELKLT